ncbi:MAG: Holliday junction resolvase RecU [Erysipelotrichaceae bacterium]|nr:Holliday junction resolvase RecU [Erysipelotrichaceae bacterium]
MVQYPNKKKAGPALSRNGDRHYTAHRGMNLEEDISLSNKFYLANDRAVIYKKPTPVQIVKVDYPSRNAARIIEGYYQRPSTTDYNGIYRGQYIDFEAKETRQNKFPFINIHEHQIEHLGRIKKHGGIAFVIIAFTHLQETYLIDADYVIDRYYHAEHRYMTYEEVQANGHLIRQGYQPRLYYLDVVDEVYFKECE